MTGTSGKVASGFEAVADAFTLAQECDPGGAQLCVYQDGQVVVDLWTGEDKATSIELDGDTPIVLWSATKGLIALAAAMLYERGMLDVDAPVSQYWPEFATNGKAHITVAHLLTHTAGLPFFPSAAGIVSGDLPNWDRCVQTLAEATPLWDPGTAAFYHPFTYGYLNGEVIRRAAGVRAPDFFMEHISAPLNLDCWIGGVPPAREAEVVHRNLWNVVTPTRTGDTWAKHGVDLSDPVVHELILGMDSIPDMVPFLNTTAGHSMEFGGAGGIASARSVAAIYAACFGEVRGVRLLSASTLDHFREPRTRDLGPIPPLSSVPNERAS